MSNYTPFTNRKTVVINDTFIASATVHTVEKDSLISYRGLFTSSGVASLVYQPANALIDSQTVLAETAGGPGVGRCYGAAYLPAGTDIKVNTSTSTVDGAFYIFELD